MIHDEHSSTRHPRITTTTLMSFRPPATSAVSYCWMMARWRVLLLGATRRPAARMVVRLTSLKQGNAFSFVATLTLVQREAAPRGVHD
eukprot:COSAG01_NODE_2023_length_8616_cov_89.751673_1_plen_88_part_00